MINTAALLDSIDHTSSKLPGIEALWLLHGGLQVLVQLVNSTAALLLPSLCYVFAVHAGMPSRLLLVLMIDMEFD
jgi:hypothetical protein